MFSKGIVLIFLILGLSSSIAHAVPHENLARDPCEVCLSVSFRPRTISYIPTQDTPSKASPDRVASPLPSKDSKDTTSTDKKGKSTSCLTHRTVLYLLYRPSKDASVKGKGTGTTYTGTGTGGKKGISTSCLTHRTVLTVSPVKRHF